MYYYIINPAAGDGSINDIQAKLKATLSRLRIEGEFVKTIGPGDAAKLAKRAIEQGYKTIVAVGGDNTVDEVATAAHQSGSPVAVGIIPIGKHNTLARRLGITSWKQAGQALAARRLSKVQLIEINDQLCIHQLTINAGAITSQDGQGRAKPLRYRLRTELGLDVKGAATSIAITNQKMHDEGAPNRLLVKISTLPHPPSSLLARLAALGPRAQTQLTQLHAESLQLDLGQKATAVYDNNKQLADEKFEVKLTDAEIAFVCRGGRRA